MRFLLQFHNILVYILLGAGFIKLLVSLWLDAAVILAVVVINGLLGFLQEGKAERAARSGSSLRRTWCRGMWCCWSPATRFPRTCG